MNTVDAIGDLGGKCANFLDTGGKATSETVKSSFRIILKDPRVKTIFVNIFGGLTLCDMIADGIMLAYKDLGIKVPVVVRLRGTNEEIGQKMVSKPEPCQRKLLKFLRLRKVACLYTHLMTSMKQLKRSLNWLDKVIDALCHADPVNSFRAMLYYLQIPSFLFTPTDFSLHLQASSLS